MSNRINLIACNAMYTECYHKIVEWEKERVFCKHDMTHFLDVARITYILTLEDKANINKEHIYAAALLHDIGRYKQYDEGIPHEIASASLCVPILKKCNFTNDEIECIKEAILNHRNPLVKHTKNLSGYLYNGDKMSRACSQCHAMSMCNWANKNLEINY